MRPAIRLAALVVLVVAGPCLRACPPGGFRAEYQANGYGYGYAPQQFQPQFQPQFNGGGYGYAPQQFQPQFNGYGYGYAPQQFQPQFQPYFQPQPQLRFDFEFERRGLLGRPRESIHLRTEPRFAPYGGGGYPSPFVPGGPAPYVVDGFDLSGGR